MFAKLWQAKPATIAETTQKPRRLPGMSKRQAREQLRHLPSGCNGVDLARRFGVHPSTITRWLKDWQRDHIVRCDRVGRDCIVSVIEPRQTIPPPRSIVDIIRGPSHTNSLTA